MFELLGAIRRRTPGAVRGCRAGPSKRDAIQHQRLAARHRESCAKAKPATVAGISSEALGGMRRAAPNRRLLSGSIEFARIRAAHERPAA